MDLFHLVLLTTSLFVLTVCNGRYIRKELTARDYFCTKLRACPRDRYGQYGRRHRALLPGVGNQGPSYKVCGYDEEQALVGEFNELCDMYKANCDGKGVYDEVPIEVCLMRESYVREHANETFEWIHIRDEVTDMPKTQYFKGAKNPWLHKRSGQDQKKNARVFI